MLYQKPLNWLPLTSYSAEVGDLPMTRSITGKKGWSYYDCLRPGVDKVWSWAKPSPMLVFVNKVLLEHSHTHSYTYCLCRFCAIMVKLMGCDRDHMICKA